MKEIFTQRVVAVLLLLIGYLSAWAQPSNNDKVDALLLVHETSWVSIDAAYTTVGATPDGAVASGCTATTGNVWFKFQAASPEVDLRVVTGGAKGTLMNLSLKLFDETGNLVACHQGTTYISFLQRATLTVGTWYYFSVDAWTGGVGTFTVSLKNELNNDVKEKATVLTHSSFGTSADAAYTTVGATPDGTLVSGCTATGSNVWFKFQATSPEVDLRVVTGGSKGTLINLSLKLFDETGNLVACHQGTTYFSFLQRATLIVGTWYYFSVDSWAENVGTFTVSLKNELSNDVKEKGTVLTHSPSWTSADAAYTTVGATPDGATANGCTTTTDNVWFKFQATSQEIDFRLLVNGTKGTLRNPSIKLFDASGNLVGCHQGTTYFSFLQLTTLTSGAWYYISVDSHNGQPGTFTLSLKNALDYDIKAKATELTHSASWTSADAAYTTIGATPDGAVASGCMTTGDNVWFKFQATSAEIDLRVAVGGQKGSLLNASVKLFDGSGNLMGCNANTYFAFLQLTTLTSGAWYYISVDSYNGQPGTFTLSIKNDFGNDFKAKAQILPHEGAWCSGDALFTNAEATADETNNSTCGTSFNKNVWFKFQATSTNATVKLKTGSTLGTLTNGSLFLMSESGTMLACQTGSGVAEVHLTTTTLTKGQWYYLTVDNLSGTSGTFSLCLEGGVEASALCDNIYCDEQGGVGVGTSIVPAGYRMAVAGKIIAEGVKVELQTKWPDYVFEKDYYLRPLTEVDAFIQDKGYLPGMPSAKEVETGGIDLGEMNAKLLQKVEELTLYLIEQKKETDKMKQENEAMRKDISMLKEKLKIQ